MPIYAYKCLDCGEEAEYIQKFSDPPMTECESCGGRIEKQITAAAFHLKGGGWYKDGYASSKSGAGDAKGSSSGSESKKSKDKSASKAKGASKDKGAKGGTKQSA